MRLIRFSSRSSENFRDRNSPALSVWRDPTSRTGNVEVVLACALKRLTNLRTASGYVRRVGLVAEEVHELEASVVVDEHESVLVVSLVGASERPHDIGVDEASSVRRLVRVGRVVG